MRPAVFLAALIPFALLLRGLLLTGDLGADPLKTITDVTGLWTLRFLCITLAVTPVRRLTGWNAAIRFRRMLGLFAFFYGSLHLLIFIVADRLASLGFPSLLVWQNIRELAASIGGEIYKRPYITIGFTALLLLIPLAVTSTNKMMRRLGRRWQKLHRLIYVIAVLGVWHFYWQVKRDVREPLIYAGILALLLGYRWASAQQRKATSTSGSATAPGRT